MSAASVVLQPAWIREAEQWCSGCQFPMQEVELCALGEAGVARLPAMVVCLRCAAERRGA